MTPRGTPERRSLSVLVYSLAVLGVCQSLFIRYWLATHVAMNSDEGVTGLMALSIQRGHFTAFYWGQNYGGVEPFLDAVGLWFLPTTGASLHLISTGIALIGVAFVFLSARRLLRSRLLAIGVASLASVFPLSTLTTQTQAYGFRSFTYAASCILLFGALSLSEQAEVTWTSVAIVGVVAGLGWWSSPEVVYLGLPALLMVLAVLRRQPQASQRWARFAAAVAGFMVGSLPWWWASLRSGFASLHSANGQGSTYGSRLQSFFSHNLLQLFGLQKTWRPWGIGFDASGAAHGMAVAVLVVLLGSASLAAVKVGGPKMPLGVATLLSPLLVAAAPPSWYFKDGRYTIYLVPLYLLTLGVGLEFLVSRKRWGLGRQAQHSLVAGVTVVALLGGMLWTSRQFRWWASTSSVLSPASTRANCPPDGSGLTHVVSTLQEQGLTVGWANYWLAYRLNYLSEGRLHFSPLPGDGARSKGDLQTAMVDQRSVWLLQGPGINDQTPSNDAVGPGGLNWGNLKARFAARGVKPRIKRIEACPGSLQQVVGAHGKHQQFVWVVIPNRRVGPKEMGLLPA